MSWKGKVALLILSTTSKFTNAKFNNEVKSRVTESLEEFLNVPVKANNLVKNFRTNEGFRNALSANNRDAYLVFANTVSQTFQLKQSLYFGMEDGMMAGSDLEKALYREPGNSGYNATADYVPLDKVKYLNTCVNESGESIECLMKPGRLYIECIDDCSLQPCADPDSQRDCKALEGAGDKIECESNIKWCQQYEKKTAVKGSSLGYVPLTMYCTNDHGKITQTHGDVRNALNTDGNCLFEDMDTKVNRWITDDYEYCGGEEKACNNTFTGGFKSVNYDPRWRPWYEQCKSAQKSAWTPVYPWFGPGSTIGMTYTTPLYSIENGKKIFKGAVAYDYVLEDINRYLVTAYNNTDISVCIYEEAEPHFLIGSSLQISSTINVLAENKTVQCPQGQNEGCELVRQKMDSLGDMDGSDMKDVITEAFMKQKENGFPQDNLVIIKASDHGSPSNSKAYLSQSQVFEKIDENLRWSILIVMPMETAKGNAIMKDNSLFGLVIFIGILGYMICFTLFVLIYKNRKKRAIINSDWRFTSAFIIGCATLNLSSLLLLGPNTDSFCLSRMLVFHLLFVATLAPLFAKTWRMYQLVGKQNMRRKAITNKKAMLYTLPFLVIQSIILLIFAFVDPPQQTEKIEPSLDGDFLQNLICKQKSAAFMIVELIFEGGLLLIGCYLAWKTRNLNKDFGEARQMVAAMYNIGFVALMILLVSIFMSVEEIGKYVLQTIGILWGTVFSSAAFVVPRLLQSRRDKTKTRFRVSGNSKDSPTNISQRNESSNSQSSSRSDIRFSERSASSSKGNECIVEVDVENNS